MKKLIAVETVTGLDFKIGCEVRRVLTWLLPLLLLIPAPGGEGGPTTIDYLART
jgi:hypothetical protein